MPITTSRIGDVSVDHAAPLENSAGRPPIVLVHGGSHGSWIWEHYLDYAADAGWDAYAPNWLGRGGSAELDPTVFAARSLADVAYEIGTVADHLGRTPILIGHSTGGLAALNYAAKNPIAALVLLAPAMPASLAGAPGELPADPTAPWGPPPFEAASSMFFQGLDELTARSHYAKLTAEYPTAVLEATRGTMVVDIDAIDAPVLAVAGEIDTLSPPAAVELLAERIQAKYHLVTDRGHALPFEPGWRDTAGLVFTWLGNTV